MKQVFRNHHSLSHHHAQQCQDQQTSQDAHRETEGACDGLQGLCCLQIRQRTPARNVLFILALPFGIIRT
jgi:hypothetical protein